MLAQSSHLHPSAELANVKRLILSLAVAAVLFPMGMVLALGVAWLLQAMGDVDGGVLVKRLVILAGALWAFDLTTLVLCLSVDAILDFGEHDHGEGEE